MLSPVLYEFVLTRKTTLNSRNAINSMYRWYKKATRCYAYLSDVTICDNQDQRGQFDSAWEPAFRKSRRFTWGWTLQELLTPALVDFYSSEGERLRNKSSLETILFDITRIARKVLKGWPLSEFHISERLS